MDGDIEVDIDITCWFMGVGSAAGIGCKGGGCWALSSFVFLNSG